MQMQMGLHVYCKNYRGYFLTYCIFCSEISQIKFEADEKVRRIGTSKRFQVVNELLGSVPLLRSVTTN